MDEQIAAVLAGTRRWAVVQGDCYELMGKMPADSVQLCFGSPPYVDCRTYLENGVDLGIAREAGEWVAWMTEIFRSCLHVCTGLTAMVVEGRTEDFSYDATPFRLMAALANVGITLRKPPIYRRVGIPGSGGPDWLRNDYEPIICATRGGKLPWSDNTACGHPPKWAPGGEMSYRVLDGSRVNYQANHWNQSGKPKGGRRPNGKLRSTEASTAHCKRGCVSGTKDGDTAQEGVYFPPVKANPGNVIDCKTGGGQLGSLLAHENEAPFPESLAEFFVLSFAPPNGIVLDPFAGSGTTLAVAVKHGRRAIGIDLRASQVELSKRRMSGVTPSLFSVVEENAS